VAFGYSRMRGVDEVGLLGVAVGELTHERADDGDLLPALADLVQYARDEVTAISAYNDSVDYNNKVADAANQYASLH
jgi:hypothetical protein